MNAELAQQRKKTLSTWTIPLAYVFTTLAVGMLFPRIEPTIRTNRMPPWRTGRVLGLGSRSLRPKMQAAVKRRS